MKRFNRMLARLELAQKVYDPQILYKDLWKIGGGWSTTTRGMLLAQLDSDTAKTVKESYSPHKEDKEFKS